MPTISCTYKDLTALIGRTISVEALPETLKLVKGELKGYDAETDELRIELNDTNRPDLWCTEGIARQLAGGAKAYPFFDAEAVHRVEVDARLESIRPLVGAFIARGPGIDEPTLIQMIQTQEKLTEGLGRRRSTVAIGIYNAAKITFPVHYRAAAPEEVRFVPLGFDEPMTLTRILAEHPKGTEYRSLVEGKPFYPLLIDSADVVLSFPPIINSRASGEVQVGDNALFVEATGDDPRALTLALDILACNFADRGFEIERTCAVFPYETSLGREVTVPHRIPCSTAFDIALVEKLLGEKFDPDEMKQALIDYGLDTAIEGTTLKATAPPFRLDLMHPVDVIEDVAMSLGLDRFTPEMPKDFTVGKLAPMTILADRARDRLIGFGFEEIISNALSNAEDLRTRMCLDNDRLVEIGNYLTETYSVLRDWLLPSLMRVEAASGAALYPHRIFEVGEIAILAETDDGVLPTNALKAAVLIAHPEANFTEIHSFLELLLYHLDLEGTLEPMEHPTFTPGRVGRIIVKGNEAGLIGEIHPQVLENWEIRMPCAAFEVSLTAIR